MTFVLGLTGSIGMGKTASAGLFQSFGIPVYDADAAVHRLYEDEAIPVIQKHFPKAVVDGAIDRSILGREVLQDEERLKKLEALVHPLVRAQEKAFLEKAHAAGIMLIVLDHPLLFETGSDVLCDAVAVVSAPADIQRARVLGRPEMTEEKLEAILVRQMPDAEKRRRAHFIIDSSGEMTETKAQVRDILRCLAGRPGSERHSVTSNEI